MCDWKTDKYAWRSTTIRGRPAYGDQQRLGFDFVHRGLFFHPLLPFRVRSHLDWSVLCFDENAGRLPKSLSSMHGLNQEPGQRHSDLCAYLALLGFVICEADSGISCLMEEGKVAIEG